MKARKLLGIAALGVVLFLIVWIVVKGPGAQMGQEYGLQFALESPLHRVDSRVIGGNVHLLNNTSQNVMIQYQWDMQEYLRLVVVYQAGAEIVNEPYSHTYSPSFGVDEKEFRVPKLATVSLGYVDVGGWWSQSTRKPGRYRVRVELTAPGLPKLVSNEADLTIEE